MTEPSLAPWRERRGAEEPPRLILGTMNFGKRTEEREARRIVDRALERGITLLDTANAYVGGEGERILGRLLQGKRHQALIATKVGLSRIGGSDSGLMQSGGRSEGLSRARILAACEESLRRLQTDVIDIYFLHAPDAATPLEESLSALQTLLQAGKIRAFATSNYASWQLVELISWCDRERMERPVFAHQIYNLLVRQLEIEYFAFAAKYGTHTTAYNPLAGGVLTGKHRRGEPPRASRFDENPMYQRRYWTERLFSEVDAYRRVAEAAGLTLTELSYAWLGTRPGVDSIIIGPGTLEHLDDAIAARARVVDVESRAAIDTIHWEFQGTDARYARV
jgi:aryl-alcohol dehydrogenase-like predicted oxidoreductase